MIVSLRRSHETWLGRALLSLEVIATTHGFVGNKIQYANMLWKGAKGMGDEGVRAFIAVG